MSEKPVTTLEELENALLQSLKLQSHYAELLNQYDGGERKTFSTLQEWLDRLEELSHD